MPSTIEGPNTTSNMNHEERPTAFYKGKSVDDTDFADDVSNASTQKSDTRGGSIDHSLVGSVVEDLTTSDWTANVVTSPDGSGVGVNGLAKQKKKQSNDHFDEYPQVMPPPTPILGKLDNVELPVMGRQPSDDGGSISKEDLEEGRDTLADFRPSDMPKMSANAIGRDSLAVGMNDMGNILCELDDNYRMSVNTQAKAESSLSPLLCASKAGDINVVQSLVRQPSTDILRRDSVHGQTAMHLAVRGGHMSVIKALLAPDIVESIINVPDNRRNTALHLAAAKSRRITKLLLDGGAEVDNFNMRNQTPLGVHVLTAKKDDPVMAEMLLQHKADPNAAVDKSTLLHVAVDRSMFEIASRLVKHGARFDMKDENGKIVFDKLDRKVLKKLLKKIQYPPVWIPNQDRSNCMVCIKKFGKLSIGVRRHHCRHCGRICCGECSHLTVESWKFPKGFSDRMKNGTGKPNQVGQRVCKTCYGIFKERDSEKSSPSGAKNFYNRVVNHTWDEMKGTSNSPCSTI